MPEKRSPARHCRYLSARRSLARRGVQQGAELEKKIASLVTAGEESGSFSEAEARLRALQRKCRYRTGGRLPELEAEMAAVNEKLAAIDKTAEELARAEELAENARLHSANAQKNFAGAQEKRRTDAMAQLEACRAALMKKSRGLLKENFIEGMACSGGCIGGAGCLTHGEKNKAEVDKYGKEAYEKTISDAVSILKKK